MTLTGALKSFENGTPMAHYTTEVEELDLTTLRRGTLVVVQEMRVGIVQHIELTITSPETSSGMLSLRNEVLVASRFGPDRSAHRASVPSRLSIDEDWEQHLLGRDVEPKKRSTRFLAPSKILVREHDQEQPPYLMADLPVGSRLEIRTYGPIYWVERLREGEEAMLVTSSDLSLTPAEMNCQPVITVDQTVLFGEYLKTAGVLSYEVQPSRLF